MLKKSKFHNVIWIALEKVLRIISGIIIGAMVARYLGPSNLGDLRYAMSIVGLFSAFCILGLDSLLAVDLIRDKKNTNSLLGTAFFLKFFASILIISLIILMEVFFDKSSNTKNLIIIISFIYIFQSVSVIEVYFQSNLNSKFVTYSSLIALFIINAAKIIFVFKDAPLIFFGWLTLVESILICFSLVYFYKASGMKILLWNFDKKIAINMLARSKYMIIGIFSAAVYQKTDQIFLKQLINETAVGIYAVSITLAESWVFIAIAITKSFSSEITSAKFENGKFYLKIIQLQYDILAKIAFLITVITIITAPYVIPFLFGNEFIESILTLQILSLSTIFIFFSNGSWAYYLNNNLEKLASLRLMLGAILSIFFNLILINFFGLIGAACSVFLSYLVSSYLFNLISLETRLNFYLQTRAILNIFNIKSWIKNFSND